LPVSKQVVIKKTITKFFKQFIPRNKTCTFSQWESKTHIIRQEQYRKFPNLKRTSSANKNVENEIKAMDLGTIASTNRQQF
jgi:membrane-bound lytic murein transglycosylase MltF